MPSTRLLIIVTVLFAAISAPAHANMKAELVTLFKDQAKTASTYLARGDSCGHSREVADFKKSLLDAASRSGASNLQLQALGDRLEDYRSGYIESQCDLSAAKAEENLNFILYMTGINMNTARN